MDKQPYIEKMLETENLTDALEDSDANWLLDWGTSQMDTVLQGADNRDAAGQRANDLMAVMRKINRIAGSYADKSPQSLANDLDELHNLFQQAFRKASQNQSETKVSASAAGNPSAEAGSPPAEAQNPSAEEGSSSAEAERSSSQAKNLSTEVENPSSEQKKPSAEAEKPLAKEKKATGEMRAEEMEDRAEGRYPTRKAQAKPQPSQNQSDASLSFDVPGQQKKEAPVKAESDEHPKEKTERANEPTTEPVKAQQSPTPADLEAMARQLSGMDTREALEYLTNLYFKGPAS